MKKFTKFLLAILLLVSTMAPLSAKAQEVAPDEALLNVINGLKEIESFKGNYEGNMNMVYTDGTADFTTDGDIQFKISPELELGFDLNMAMDAEHHDGSTESETYDLMYYIVDQTMYMLEDDSSEEEDGEWVTEDVSTLLGMDAQQIASQYQMLISLLEGTIRSYYLPSKVNQLLSEKTTVEENGDGYTITINSFETEEEWVEFFEALQELEHSLTQETVAADVELDSQLSDFEEDAKALAAGLTYTITIEVDANYFINSIHVIVDSDVQELEAESDSDTPESVQAEFNYEVTETNFEESIEVPAEVPVN